MVSSYIFPERFHPFEYIVETQMKSSSQFLIRAIVLIFCFCSFPGVGYSFVNPKHPPVSPANELPEELKGIGITGQLGTQVSIQHIQLRDESGNPVTLSQYFHNDKPVLLNLVYYGCPSLCSVFLNGLIASLKNLDWTAGNQFEIVTVSIQPKEDFKLAQAKKKSHIQALGRPEAASGWHFLTGEQDQIQKLASEIGFGYKWIESENQFAHGAGLYVLTPQGKISQILYGIQFPPQDLKLALIEASHFKIGSVVDRLLMFCYRYNAQTRRYTFYATNIMAFAGLATLLSFGGYLFLFWRRQRQQSEVQA